jgi:hypothetical protein
VNVSDALKVPIVLGALFSANVAGIVIGYYNFSLPPDPTIVGWIFRDIPVLSAATILTLGCLFVLFAAYWLGRGSRKVYAGVVMAWGYIAPFLIVLTLLPGDQEKPNWASLNLYAMFAVLCIANVVSCYLLQNWIWFRGDTQ